MKNLWFILLTLSLFTSLHAQVSGCVSDASGEKLPFANVVLLSTDSVMITGGTTDLEGRFSLTLSSPGRYLVRASAIGYEDGYGEKNIMISEVAQRIDLGCIELSSGAIELATLEVKARKLQLEQLPEGTIVNVQSSILTKGSSALQVLERSPGVFIDRRNNNISLNGRDGVTILLNGKTLRVPLEALLGTLNGMSADNIEKIELLTSPGAKYDADGTAGVINIVLKQNKATGTRGSFSLNTGYGYRSKAGGSLQLSGGEVGTYWYGNYAYVHDHATDGYHGIGSNVVPALGGTVGFDFRNNVVHRQNNHQLGAGFEQQLSEVTKLGLGVQANQSEDRFSTLNQAAYLLPQDSFFQARINVLGRNRWRNVSPNIFLETKALGGGQLQLDANYLYFANDNPTLINNSFQDTIGRPLDLGNGIFASTNRGVSTTAIHIATLQADFSKELSTSIGLEAGAKASRSQTKNRGEISRLENGVWQPDERTDSQLMTLESIAAAYTSFKFEIGAKSRLTTAVRYELWDQRFGGVTADRRSGRFFPSFSFSHQATEHRQWQVSYARRINRPTYNDLAAALTYSGLVSVFSGNPLLRPTLSHQLRAGYAFNGKLIALSWQREDGTIARFQATANPSSDLIVIGPQNIDLINNLDLQLTVPLTLTNWWSAQLNATSSWRSFRLSYTPETIEQQYLHLGLNGNQTFTLPKDWTVELSGWYNSGVYNGSVELKSMGAISLGLKKELPKGWGNVQFVAEDLFKTSGVRFHYGALGQEHYDISAIGTYRPEAARHQVFRLSYFRDFGGDRNGKSIQRGAEEERSRLRL